MQMPGPKQPEIQCRPAHFRAMHTYQPGSRLAVSQHQTILARVRAVAQPAVPAWFTHRRLVFAVEEDALVGVAHTADVPDGNFGQWRGRNEELLRLLEPTLPAIELKCRDDLAMYAIEPCCVGRRAQQVESQQHDFVAQRLRRECQGRPRYRKFAGLTIEVRRPRPSVETAGPGERPQHLGKG